jgi:hypothetical protein
MTIYCPVYNSRKIRNCRANNISLVLGQRSDVDCASLTVCQCTGSEFLATNESLGVTVIRVQGQGHGELVAEEKRHVLDLVQQFLLFVTYLQLYRVISLLEFHRILNTHTSIAYTVSSSIYPTITIIIIHASL